MIRQLCFKRIYHIGHVVLNASFNLTILNLFKTLDDVSLWKGTYTPYVNIANYRYFELIEGLRFIYQVLFG